MVGKMIIIFDKDTLVGKITSINISVLTFAFVGSNTEIFTCFNKNTLVGKMEIIIIRFEKVPLVGKIKVIIVSF